MGRGICPPFCLCIGHKGSKKLAFMQISKQMDKSAQREILQGIMM